MTNNQWIDGPRAPRGAAPPRARLSSFTVAAALLLGATGCDQPDPEGPAPWEGTLREGVASMQASAEAGDFAAALTVADRILAPDRLALFRQRLGVWTGGASESALRPFTWALDWAGVHALLDADRGEVEYARGQVELLRGGAKAGASQAPGDETVFGYDAEQSMERARAAGGPVRPDALTVKGTIILLRGEDVRATIPEIAQATGQGAQPPGFPAAPPAPGAQPASGDEEEKEDPIEKARKLYRLAKEPLIERLQFHAEGDDPKSESLATTRAHLELITRRLRELDEIEKQREENQDQEQDQENEDKEDGDPKDDESKKDEEPKDGEPEEGEPGDEEPEGEPKEEESDTPPEEEPSQEEEQPQSEPQIEEKNLTEEELARFLEQAKQDREEGEERRQQLLKKRKMETQRDW